MLLEERIRRYESVETNKRFDTTTPIYVRLDGRSFSNYTSHLKKPFDERLSAIMRETTRYLVKESNANIGYTQSDEISLVFYRETGMGMFFDGKMQKVISVLASLATAKFVELMLTELPELREKGLPSFDCRVYNLPTLSEAANAILWRSMDGIRNSIQMATRNVYSHSQMRFKDINEQLTMLEEKGIDWNDYPKYFKEGSFFKRVTYELENEYGKFLRHRIDEVLTDIRYVDMPIEEKIELIKV